MSDETKWPLMFGLHGKSFEWVYNNKKEFVDFTLNEMGSPTGLFKVWKIYCQEKYKDAQNSSRKTVAVV